MAPASRLRPRTEGGKGVPPQKKAKAEAANQRPARAAAAPLLPRPFAPLRRRVRAAEGSASEGGTWGSRGRWAVSGERRCCCSCGSCILASRPRRRLRAWRTCRIRASQLRRPLRPPECLGWCVHCSGEDAAVPVAAEAAGAQAD